MLVTHLITGLALVALLLAVTQYVKIRVLSHCHFGVLGPSAMRWQIRLWTLLRRRCAVIAFDVRKMHDGNEVFGYSTMNELVGEFVRVRLRPGRTRDVIGQVGGDEFIALVSDPSAGELVIGRLLERMREINEQLPAEKRKALAERTGGLVDGLHAAIALIPDTRNAYAAAQQAIDEAVRIKGGNVTGSRSTSGMPGTQIAILREVTA